jgi:DNA-directed RNA polymerase subunit RPC12/RpoP
MCYNIYKSKGETKMDYKCTECGRLFLEEEVLEMVQPHGEVFLGCPNCKGYFEEIKKCKFCEEDFGESELIEGICEKCIKDAITTQNVRNYLEESGCFADFMIRIYYGFEECVGQLNETDEKEVDFKALFDEKATVKNLQKLLEQYVYEDFENFAEWLSLKDRKEVCVLWTKNEENS